tara:strand:+ start:693 stop:1262 length:570 start_codon:yes stop_codon:yes gene_type:complete
VGFRSKLSSILGIDDDDMFEGDFDDYQDEEYSKEMHQKINDSNNLNALANLNPFNNNNQSSKVVGMPGISDGHSEVCLMEARSFDEMQNAIQAIRERKTVILNLTMMDPDTSQRALDFVSGGAFAIDGYQERVGPGIFIFAPSCVNVTNSSSQEASPSNYPKENSPQYSLRKNTAPEPAWGDSKLSAFS